MLTPGLTRGLFTTNSHRSAPPSSNVLVLIQLTGGNDGLNTVIPLQDAAYHRLRPTLAIAPEDTLRLDGKHGLHPACAGLHRLYQHGKITLLPQVSATQTAVGHFAAGEIWASGQIQSESDTGWLGRWLDQRQVAGRCTDDPAAVFFGHHLPPALRARDPHKVVKIHAGEVMANRPDRLYQHPRNRYPSGLFDRSLGMIVYLMRDHPATQIYCLTLGGFDTHRDQATQHAKLLHALSESLGTFQQDLESHGLADRVMTMFWSEFGRQPAENDFRGTDHGTTGPVLLLGSRVNGGILGDAMTATPEPSAATDFRRIYATLLEDWLACPADAVLDRTWDKLPLVRNDAAYLPMP